MQAAGFDWNGEEAHSAVYDVDRTALLFCHIVNRWHELSIASLPADPPIVRSA